MTVFAVGIGVNWHVTNIGWQQQPSVYLRRVYVCVPCQIYLNAVRFDLTIALVEKLSNV